MKPLTTKQILAKLKRSKATRFDVLCDFGLNWKKQTITGCTKKYTTLIAFDTRYTIYKLTPVKPLSVELVRSGRLD